MNSGMLFKLKNFTVICNYDDIINRLKKKKKIDNKFLEKRKSS